MKTWAFLLCLVGFLMSCSTSSSLTGRAHPRGISHKSQTFWVGDVVQNKMDRTQTICRGDEKEEVQEAAMSLDALLTVVTLGMYSHNSSRTYCK